MEPVNPFVNTNEPAVDSAPLGAWPHTVLTALIPLTVLFIFMPDFENEDPFSIYEDKLMHLLLATTCFCLVGLSFNRSIVLSIVSLSNHQISPSNITIGIVGSACILWMLFAYGPILFYSLLTLIVLGTLSLSIYVPKSRSFMPLISIFLLWFLMESNLQFLYEMFWEGYWSESEFKHLGYLISDQLHPIFFFTALVPAFMHGHPIESDVAHVNSIQSVQSNNKYITLSEASEAVLPALLLSVVSIILGSVFIVISGDVVGLFIGILVIVPGITIAQFKLLADAINRGIRRANR